MMSLRFKVVVIWAPLAGKALLVTAATCLPSFVAESRRLFLPLSWRPAVYKDCEGGRLAELEEAVAALLLILSLLFRCCCCCF